MSTNLNVDHVPVYPVLISSNFKGDQYPLELTQLYIFVCIFND